MTFLEMQTMVQQHLGQKSGNSYFTATQVKSAINEALKEISKEAMCLLTYHQITTVDGTGAYSLPTEFLQLAMVEIEHDSSRTELMYGLDILEFAQMANHDLDRTGEPEFYKLEYGATDTTNALPGDLHLYPKPDDNGGANYTLRIYSYQLASDLTNDADISEVPRELHMAATYYAAMTLAMKNADYQRFNALSQLYARSISSFKEVQNIRDRSRTRPAYFQRVRHGGQRHPRGNW